MSNLKWEIPRFHSVDGRTEKQQWIQLTDNIRLVVKEETSPGFEGYRWSAFGWTSGTCFKTIEEAKETVVRFAKIQLALALNTLNQPEIDNAARRLPQERNHSLYVWDKDAPIASQHDLTFQEARNFAYSCLYSENGKLIPGVRVEVRNRNGIAYSANNPENPENPS